MTGDMTAPQRLAERIRARRRELGGMTKRRLARESGLGDSAIQDLERGERDNYRETTLIAVSRALGWTEDSAQRILDGYEPIKASEVAKAAETDRLHQRVGQLEAELAEALALLRDLHDDRFAGVVDDREALRARQRERVTAPLKRAEREQEQQARRRRRGAS